MNRLLDMFLPWHKALSAEEYMLLDDIYQKIMPYRRSHDSKPFRVNLTPENERSRFLILHALGGELYQDLEYVTAEFIRQSALTLCRYGSLYFRVKTVENVHSQRSHTGRSNQSLEGLPKLFSIEHLDPNKLRKRFYNIYTLERSVIDARKTEWNLVPSDELLLLRIPKFNETSVPRACLSLGLIQYVNSGRMAPQVDSYTKQISFEVDIAEQARLTRLAMACATSAIGWSARCAFDEYSTAYLMIQRQLRFAEFLLRLRDYILERINHGIVVAGKKLQVETRVSFSGAITNEDIVRLRGDIQAGRKIAEVLKELRELQ